MAFNPFSTYKVEREPVETTFLDEEELRTIINFDTPLPRLEKAKDMFLFGCFTGLSYIDIKTLTSEHFEKDNAGRIWIKKRRIKTGILSRIPLLPIATIETAQLLQNCMLIAGIGTLIQLYPIWKIGSGLPVVMGLSFTFLAACMSAASQDYGIMVGSIIVGGIFEGILGLTAKYWRRIISPVLSSCVVIAIGLSILNVGVSSFGSSSAYPLGSWQNLLVATITLTAALVFHTTLKGVAKQLYVLLGMLVGYVVSIFFGMVDFASMGQTIQSLGVVAIPKLFAFKPQFQLGSILSFALVRVVIQHFSKNTVISMVLGHPNSEITCIPPS